MRGNKTALIAMIAFGIIVLANIFIVVKFGNSSVNDTATQTQNIEKAIKKAAIQCYALEGSYPNQVNYLEDHYGISYDHDRYFVHYRYDGSNLLPEIRVLTAFDEEE
ncbi:MAG: hypothetical protein LBR98_00815 [Syntrophomonadaceae bacterium]|jgi:hypothetical protein|nr:hypothetical protein [Syntrophomonadaceae bacterium]